MASTEQTLPISDRLLAIEEIKAVCARYALGLDTFEIDVVLSAFAADAVFDASAFGLSRPAGHDEIREFFRHTLDVMAEQIHIFTNFIITIDGPDAARGTNYLYEDGVSTDGGHIRCWGLNTDRYVRTPAGWKIAERILRPLVAPQLEGFK